MTDKAPERMCPIDLDDTPEVCSAGTCDKCIADRIATRYEKTSRSFMAMIKLASIRLWIEFYESAA